MSTNFDFDQQAEAFDRRAGLPTEAAQGIARGFLETVPDSGTILDLGAGTGEIGNELAQAGGQRYLGLDFSLSMLGVFRHKLQNASQTGASQTGATLLRADAEQPWPLRDGTVSNFFFSRSAHLLQPQHLVTEVLRTAKPSGALLTIGRVRREKDSVRAQMRRRMRQALTARGVEGKAGEVARKKLVATLSEHGGEALKPRRVASWPCREQPIQSLSAWSKKQGLAGLPLPSSLRQDVLAEVQGWAQERWGDLDTVHGSTEHYELSVVRLPNAE